MGNFGNAGFSRAWEVVVAQDEAQAKQSQSKAKAQLKQSLSEAEAKLKQS